MLRTGVPFTVQRRVSFVDCDPAGIAYTGRLVDIAIQSIEVFWHAVLDGQGWYELQEEHGLGMPFVQLESRFRSPVTPRGLLDCTVEPVALGRSSVSFCVTAQQDGLHCFELRSVSAFVAIRDRAPTPIPDWVRSAFRRYYPALSQ
ncbi:thioesterase superfamily protein [Novosphingobium nitrogenifigens DSM 19370]|uniref:Thioesterase superfamily protein n=1 Tax=Novosphingobium nitrogenifigens DSM 19370 TaxID=983920 RepID=F1ZD02_9SPHN|nr:acyl-CoA thioesterase [Novosphingobium nitrogenifigens]EGD57511.1 thioesterase superfamily protein [Novosphingobium nitrogenifigens DSM 19370]